MNQIFEYKRIWKKRYARIQKQRLALWKALKNPEINQEWILTRPKPSQWAIDEIIRHMLASDIRYIHQSIDPNLPQIEEAIGAQWVGDVFFRIKESTHISLDQLIEIAKDIEKKTELLLDSPNEVYEKVVKAPWGEEMKAYELFEAFYDHEQYHRGQVYFIITFFRGIPRKIRTQIDRGIKLNNQEKYG